MWLTINVSTEGNVFILLVFIQSLTNIILYFNYTHKKKRLKTEIHTDYGFDEIFIKNVNFNCIILYSAPYS